MVKDKFLTNRGQGGNIKTLFGAVAQFGRALAWHARGQGFDPPRLHQRRI